MRNRFIAVAAEIGTGVLEIAALVVFMALVYFAMVVIAG